MQEFIAVQETKMVPVNDLKSQISVAFEKKENHLRYGFATASLWNGLVIMNFTVWRSQFAPFGPRISWRETKNGLTTSHYKTGNSFYPRESVVQAPVAAIIDELVGIEVMKHFDLNAPQIPTQTSTYQEQPTVEVPESERNVSAPEEAPTEESLATRH